MTLDLTDLERFANDDAPAPVVRKGKGTEKTWHSPEVHEFVDCSVLAFDPSLTATGAVCLWINAGRIEVRQAWSFGADSGSEGWENVLRSGEELERQFDRLFQGRPHQRVVHESPAQGGGKFLKPELTLTACYALRVAARARGFQIAPMIAPQTHKRLICGNGNAKKPVEHAALAALAESLPIVGYDQITNEAKRDALCVGLAHSLRGAPCG